MRLAAVAILLPLDALSQADPTATPTTTSTATAMCGTLITLSLACFEAIVRDGVPCSTTFGELCGDQPPPVDDFNSSTKLSELCAFECQACFAQPFCDSGTDLESAAGPCFPAGLPEWTPTCDCIDTIILSAGCQMEVASVSDGTGTVWGPFTHSIAVENEGIPYDTIRGIRVFPQTTTTTTTTTSTTTATITSSTTTNTSTTTFTTTSTTTTTTTSNTTITTTSTTNTATATAATTATAGSTATSTASASTTAMITTTTAGCTYELIGGGFCHFSGRREEEKLRIDSWRLGDHPDAERACCEDLDCAGFHYDNFASDFVLLADIGFMNKGEDRRECWRNVLQEGVQFMPSGAPPRRPPLVAAAALAVLTGRARAAA